MSDEELLNTICKDMPTIKHLLRRQLQEIYFCIDKLHNNIIYLTPEQLESLEEDTLTEELIQEEICYDNI